MYVYSLVNYTLHCDLPIGNLVNVEISNSSDFITIKQGEVTNLVGSAVKYQDIYLEDSNIWCSYHKANNLYLIDYPSSCSFLIDLVENIITYEKQCEIDSSSFSHILLDQIIPLFLSGKDHLVLHGSVTAYRDNAYIFLGPSGSGKSTLAKTLHNIHDFLSDDFAIINSSNVVNATYPIIRLWQDCNELTRLDNIQGSGKNRYIADQRTKEAKVKYLIFLNRIPEINETKIRKIDHEVAFSNLTKNLILLEHKSENRQRFIFDAIVNLINNCELIELTYGDITSDNSEFFKALDQI